MMKNMKIGTKVLALVGLCLAGLFLVAAVAVTSMSRIGAEISGIAERDIPMTEALTKITVHQLEQAVYFERALLLSLEGDAEGARATEQKFLDLASKVDTEIVEGEHIAQTAAEHSGSDAEREVFEQLLHGLEAVEEEHKTYNSLASDLMTRVLSGRVTEFKDELHEIEALEDKLDHELEAMLVDIEAFTHHAVTTVEAHEKSALLWMAIISVVVFLASIAVSLFLVSRLIVKPLTEVVQGLDALAAGDTTVEVQVQSNDEIGQVARTLEVFREKTIEANQAAEMAKEAQAKARAEAVEQMTGSFERTVKGSLESVVAGVTQMEGSAKTLSGSADATKTQVTGAFAATEQTSSNVQTVASAAEELAASIDEISRQVVQATDVAQSAVSEAERSNASVGELSQLADRIGAVVNLIRDIAEQTNLLALNATIEAARAGEAGKGFAVVASEVKALANQTAKATEEIGEQVTAIQQASGSSAQAIETIGRVIKQVEEVNSGIASAVEEQRAATAEIARNVQEAALGAQEVSRSMTEVTGTADQTENAAVEVLEAITEVGKQSETLSREVDKFLAEVRAAA